MTRKKKILKKTLSLLWYLVVGLLAALLLYMGSAKLRHEIPSFGGYYFFRIITESMEPAIPRGTYILVQQTPPEQIQQGDIITYYSEDPAIYGMPNTHRVVQPPESSPDGFRFVTRGDHNLVDDELTVPSDRLIGRYVCSLPRLSAFIGFFMNPTMLVILLIIQGVSIVMMLIGVKVMRMRKNQRKGEDT